MTMPLTAGYMKTLPVEILPGDMSQEQLEEALHLLESDLPGKPIEFITLVAPESHTCECGAIHLKIDDERMSQETRSSLIRLLATPYGDIVREYFRRQHGYKNIRFGWSGVGDYLPNFLKIVDWHDIDQVDARKIKDDALDDVIVALHQDAPGVLMIVNDSVGGSRVCSVKPESTPKGYDSWKSLIQDVMLVFSTPARKYLAEWVRRRHGLHIGAVNCCIIMTDDISDDLIWRKKWMSEQTSQQLTPDC